MSYKLIAFLLLSYLVNMYYCYNKFDPYKAWASDRPDPNRDMWSSGSYYHDELDAIEDEDYGSKLIEEKNNIET